MGERFIDSNSLGIWVSDSLSNMHTQNLVRSSTVRKRHYKQILQMLNTMRQAQSAGLYGDCQAGALSLCDFIEKFYNEDIGTDTVQFLVEYCEILFKVNSGELKEKVLQKHFVKIENSVNNKLKSNRIEMAFISYKAAMSDSIESIYMAAKADSDCDAFWIPIPYVERGTDGSADKIIFEGADCYPKYIECTDWQTYDISKRRPDVVFTFNPYDADNLVTSVHPDFYCKRLRDLTDMLVYVPYFVTGGSNVAEHFATLAGCIYSHKVIVESEKIREIYIREYSKVIGDLFGKPEEKFVALGSPKFDKVLNSKREDFELPEEWQRIIEGKKVVLYNTSLAAMLAGNEKYLEKLRHVIDVFRGRNDVVLWWRPHPLVEATYKSMRPHLYEEYMEIVSNFKESCKSTVSININNRQHPLGIFDSSGDCHRAVTFADAYYGDTSSIYTFFEAIGKTVLIQDINLLTEDQSTNPFPGIFAPYFDADYIYFSEANFDSFIRVNRKTYEIKSLGKLPVERKYLLFRQIIRVSDKLWLIPPDTYDIAIYDLLTNTWCDSLKIKELPEKWTWNKFSYTSKKDAYGGFSRVLAFGEYIYLIPHCYPAIVRVNTLTNELSYYDDFMETLSKYVNNLNDYIFATALKINDTEFLVPACTANVVIKFNTTTNTSIIYKVGEANYRYTSIYFDSKNYWILPRESNTPIVKWNPDTKLYKELYDYPDKQLDLFHPFFPHFYFSGHMYFIPRISNSSFRINVETDEMEEIESLQSVLDNKNDPSLYYVYMTFDSYKLYLYQQHTGIIYEYDPSTNSVDAHELMYSNESIGSEYLDKIFVNVFNKHSVVGESGIINFERVLDRLDMLKKQETKNIERNFGYGKNGQQIYTFLTTDEVKE